MSTSKAQQLTFLLEAPPALHSVSLDSEAAWMTTVVTSPLNFADFLLQSGLGGSFGRTSPEFLVLSQMKQEVRDTPVPDATEPNLILRKRQILQPCSQRFQNAGIHAPGLSLTLNISECRSGGVESSLLDILEVTGDHLQRYYLSAKACSGILRRAKKRGKTLPAPLMQALKEVAGQAPTQDS